MPIELLRTIEVGELLGVRPKRVLQLRRDGLITPSGKDWRGYLWASRDVIDLLEQRQKPRYVSVAERRQRDEIRFWSKVTKTPGCWLWTGARRDKHGYGRFAVVGSRGSRAQLAHRISYEFACGPIPQGLTIDHLCHNADTSCVAGRLCKHRACVRPEHLEAVPININQARGRHGGLLRTRCSRGHPFDDAITYQHRPSGRYCRTCHRAAAAAAYKRRRRVLSSQGWGS